MVPCRDAEFRVVFFASCLGRVFCCVVPCRDAKFRAVFPASCPVEALLCGSLPRRIVLWRFSCVVSPVEALLCGSVPRRIVSGCFSCVVSYLMSSSVVKGWVKQARDEVSDQKRMMRISGATRYGVVRMKRSHWAMKYVTRTR